MPRAARVELPFVPMHITQRGINRCQVFLDDEDFQHFRQTLVEELREAGIALHAYALMGNHYHLLLTSPVPGRLACAMRRVGSRYVPYYNWKHGRSGALWEGRFKSCLVQSSRYFLNVQRYIELNPVRAGLVSDPALYQWSSARVSLGTAADPSLVPHVCYLELGATREERAAVYRDFLQQPIATGELGYIRQHVRQSRAIGLVAGYGGTSVPV